VEEWLQALVAPAAGFVGGIVLGLAARLGRFCTLAAMEDAIFAGDTRRWRMWCMAMAVAIASLALVSAAGLVDTATSIYVLEPINLVAAILGGLAFGIGMALVGTCGYGTLARIGGGDLRAFMVFLIFAVSAAMAIGGPTAYLRAWLIDPLAFSPHDVSVRTAPDLAAAVLALPAEAVALPLAIGVSLLLLAWCMGDVRFRRARASQGWGIAVGLTITFGWLTTGWLTADPFDPQPAGSYTFAAPLGDTLLYAMISSSGAPSFGVGATLGVVAGAAVGAFMRGEFRWDVNDDAAEMRRHILGAFLMGTGSVIALGCTVGQGLTAISTLALTAPIVLAAMWAGAYLGLSYLIEGSFAAAIHGMLWRRRTN